ncbi:MAG: VWA domain-containing protein [Candidatus Muiribacteriota bacterium]
MRLEQTVYLLLLIIAGVLIYYKTSKLENRLKISISDFLPQSKIKKNMRYFLRFIVLTLLVIAIAGPQHYSEREITYGEGIDIMILLDISTSMLEQDFKPNRIEAAKKITKEFVNQRKNDRIGLVIYAGEAINWVPLTLDHSLLNSYIDLITLELIDERYWGGRGLQAKTMLPDGTAIGNALATGVNRLRKSDAKEKVILLITDGVNNRGEITPEMGAQLARENNIKIYSIGIGTGRGGGLTRTGIDEPLMKNISSLTSGKYFYAQSEEELSNVYETINQLEKTKIESHIFAVTKEYYEYFLWIMLGLLMIELLLYELLFKRLP